MNVLRQIWNDRGLGSFILGAVATGWAIAAIMVLASIRDTGTFRIDSALAPGQPKEPSPYFPIATVAGVTPLLIGAGAWLATRRAPRRRR